ncbi:LCP family protein [Allonocardiopsis opalescens]|uniref:LytR family transcriptional attenuator n=1 Tax=Allonocardiopsis opalescens TaxID=1144618 RepID=A0A2T0PT00_9ACTN|nr:LCP family protein [Allonocardiopsis opalescens]PRX91856.1 LytR family transcriptional attenuator [Allonocardiopsis opalescens]
MTEWPRERRGGDGESRHERTQVFRRPSGGGVPQAAGDDAFEDLYRPRGGRRSSQDDYRSAQSGYPGHDDEPPGPPRRPSTARSPRPRRKRGHPVRNTFIILLILLVGAPLALYVWGNSQLQRVDALADYEGRPDNQPGTTWLIVGSDSREGLDRAERAELGTGSAEGRRTDTMMLFHIPAGEDPPVLISLPRDSLVTIDGYGENRLNAAYAFEDGGPQLLARTVEQSTGIRIDHYADIGFAGFVGIVDAIGGVELCPEEPIEDPKAALDIDAGCQTLTGAEALGYVRTRATVRADLDRVERQREFFGALMSRASSPAVLFNPIRAIPLMSAGTSTFEVDDGDGLWDLMWLAMAMRDQGELVTTTVPIASTPNYGSLGSVVIWDETRSSELFNAIIEDRPVPEEALENFN